MTPEELRRQNTYGKNCNHLRIYFEAESASYVCKCGLFKFSSEVQMRI